MSGDGTQISAPTRAIIKALRKGTKYDIFTQAITYSYHLIMIASRGGPLQPYLHKARWIAQSIHPFINIQRVFYSGVPEARPEDEPEDEPEE